MGGNEIEARKKEERDKGELRKGEREKRGGDWRETRSERHGRESLLNGRQWEIRER